MNVARWKTEKDNRNQRNRQKYPNSNTFSYTEEVHVKTRSSSKEFTDIKWSLY